MDQSPVVPEQGDPTPEPPALAPDPRALLAAVIIAGVLVYNIHEKGDSYVTYGLVIGLCGVLGFDLSRFWPWGKGK